MLDETSHLDILITSLNIVLLILNIIYLKKLKLIPMLIFFLLEVTQKFCQAILFHMGKSIYKTSRVGS